MTTEITDDMIEAAGQALRAEMRPERKNNGPLYLDHDVYEYQNYARAALEAALNLPPKTFEPGQKVRVTVDDMYWEYDKSAYPSRFFEGVYVKGTEEGNLRHYVKFSHGSEDGFVWFRDSEVSPA